MKNDYGPRMKRPTRPVRRRDKATKPAGPRRDIICEQVLSKAAELFAQKGIAATTLRDISQGVGISRTLLYHYFGNKGAILDKLIRGASSTPVALLDSLDMESGTAAVDRIRVAARGLVLWVLDPRTHFNLLDRFESELPERVAGSHREAKRRVFSGMTNLVEEAIRRGEIRVVQPRVAAFAIIGMCNWTVRWFSSEGRLSPKEIADIIADLAVNSLRRSLSDRSTTSVQSLTSEIRQQLDLIDFLAAGADSRR